MLFAGDKKTVPIRLKCLRAPESIEFLQKMMWLIDFGVTVREILRIEILRKLLSQPKKYQNFEFSGLTSC